MRIPSVALTTLLMVGVTFASKFIGFLRELVLLDDVGLSAELDIFVLLFGLASVITGIGGALIFTNVAPQAGKITDATGRLALLLEGVKVGLVFWIVVSVLNLIIAATAFVQPFGQQTHIALPLIVAGVSFFTIFGEYQAALFVAAGRRTPVIFGNIIISVPLIVALVLFELSIVAYASGFVLAFGLRSLIWIWLLRRPGSDPVPNWRAAWRAPVRIAQGVRDVVVGGSAMMALQLAMMALMFCAQSLGEGTASAFSYGFRLPYLLVTTVWFVFGLRFFSDIIAQGVGQVMDRLVRFSGLNAACAIGLGALCGGYLLAFPWLGDVPLLGNPDYTTFVALSFFALPICVFYPIVEMVQRALVVAEAHQKVGPITLTILGGTVLAVIAAQWVADPRWLLAFLSLIGGLGAAVALVQRHHILPPSRG